MPPPLITSLRERPILLGGLILTLLLFISSFHHPSPSSTTFQFPGLLPSSSFSKPYHPSSVLSGSSGPIYTSPQLTREQERRYAHLRHPRIPGLPTASRLGDHGKYLFTTLTQNIEDQLPDLINTAYILVKFLGSDRVRFSIYEGPSTDSTSHIINTVLIPLLHSLGVPDNEIVSKTDQPEIDFNMVNRIQALAVLRNEALAPLWTNEAWSDTAAVVYFNDVYLRAKDVLELLHQHVKAGEKAGVETGVTTGIDWWKRHPAYYYDVWVARTITGDLFYPIEGPSWSPSDQLLSTHIPSQEAYDRLDPFQVFSSWAGMAVLAATPFLSSQHRLRFRRADPTPDPTTGESECAGSECEVLCRDMWKMGWGRVQVVPSVQLAYERDVAIDVAESLSKRMNEVGFYEETPNPENDRYVSWQSQPPEKVRCHSWPEKLGLDGNVWEQTDWTRPYDGYGA